MPNHIQNRITVTGNEDQVKELLNRIKGKDGDVTEVQIDFNKIKPMPDGMSAEAHLNNVQMDIIDIDI